MTFDVVEPDGYYDPPTPEYPMPTTQAGETVYWLSTDRAVICSGKVVQVSVDLSPDGDPKEIVVEFDGGFSVRRACQSWDQWYKTPTDAYRAGVAELSKRITDANKAMMSLVESQGKGGGK